MLKRLLIEFIRRGGGGGYRAHPCRKLRNVEACPYIIGRGGGHMGVPPYFSYHTFQILN